MRHRQQHRLVVRARVLAFAVTLGGCSGSELVQNLGAPVSDLPQPDYRRIVAANIKAIFPAQAEVGDLEISGVRLVDHLKGPAWLTCVKVDAHGKPQQYAVFIQGDKSSIPAPASCWTSATSKPIRRSRPPPRRKSRESESRIREESR
jgi:hypothetical protein